MQYKAQRQINDDELARLGQVSPFLAHLLFHRGIKSREDAEKFLNPNYDEHTHDPFLLKDAEKAAERIIKGIKNNERITIYADYDSDGIPSAVIFHDFFRRIGFQNFSIYIPHRHDEGFGMNVEAIEKVAEENTDLIVTVDCGIADVEAVNRANELGMEVIITDHHEPSKVLPQAYAIVDPKQEDCDYPDKHLCGAGVAYKLIQAILKKDRMGMKVGHEKWLLDMVGIATISDMVPLVGENRIFASYGLSVLRKSPRKGLKALLNKLKIRQEHIVEDDIGFMISPRINAASRMGVPMDAFKLLVTNDDGEAMFFTEHLDNTNKERKTIVATMVKEAKKNLHSRYGDTLPSVIVLGNPDWKPSLLGLVANTCVEEYDRPVFLWGRDGNGILKGSCRASGHHSVVDIMHAVPSGVFSQFGGHKYSGGFVIDGEHIHYLGEHLCKACDGLSHTHSSISSEEDLIDAILDINTIDWNLYNDINRLAPFGMGNKKPTFLFKAIKPMNVKFFGKNNEHVNITFKRLDGSTISAIAFFEASSDWARNIEPTKSVDMVATLEKSVFRNEPELRLRIVDVIL